MFIAELNLCMDSLKEMLTEEISVEQIDKGKNISTPSCPI